MHTNLICLVVRVFCGSGRRRMVEVLWLHDDYEDAIGSTSTHYGYEVNWKGWARL